MYHYSPEQVRNLPVQDFYMLLNNMDSVMRYKSLYLALAYHSPETLNDKSFDALPNSEPNFSKNRKEVASLLGML